MSRVRAWKAESTLCTPPSAPALAKWGTAKALRFAVGHVLQQKAVAGAVLARPQVPDAALQVVGDLGLLQRPVEQLDLAQVADPVGGLGHWAERASRARVGTLAHKMIGDLGKIGNEICFGASKDDPCAGACRNVARCARPL
jgi:hypothetical protein